MIFSFKTRRFFIFLLLKISFMMMVAYGKKSCFFLSLVVKRIKQADVSHFFLMDHSFLRVAKFGVYMLCSPLGLCAFAYFYVLILPAQASLQLKRRDVCEYFLGDFFLYIFWCRLKLKPKIIFGKCCLVWPLRCLWSGDWSRIQKC